MPVEQNWNEPHDKKKQSKMLWLLTCFDPVFCFDSPYKIHADTYCCISISYISLATSMQTVIAKFSNFYGTIRAGICAICKKSASLRYIADFGKVVSLLISLTHSEWFGITILTLWIDLIVSWRGWPSRSSHILDHWTHFRMIYVTRVCMIFAHRIIW